MYKDAGITWAEADAELAKCEREDMEARVERAVELEAGTRRHTRATPELLKELASALTPLQTGWRAGDDCRIGGCRKLGWCRGLCMPHYGVARRYGLLGSGTCQVPGCTRPLDCHGLCSRHAMMITDAFTNQQKLGVCKQEKCTARSAKRGLCSRHYQQARRLVHTGVLSWGQDVQQTKKGMVLRSHLQTTKAVARLIQEGANNSVASRQLADTLGINRNNASRRMGSAHREGLLERSGAGPSTCYRVTDKGRVLLVEAGLAVAEGVKGGGE